jgi:predicted TIM-barrel fold metal-dependent hydrolase
MTKHTPAPWKVKDNGKGQTPSIVTADEFTMTWEIARIKDVPAGAYKANANLIAAAPERIMWGTDWPHPNKYVVNPNDGDLVDAFGDWVTDETMRRKIMVDTPAAFYRF